MSQNVNRRLPLAPGAHRVSHFVQCQPQREVACSLAICFSLLVRSGSLGGWREAVQLVWLQVVTVEDDSLHRQQM